MRQKYEILNFTANAPMRCSLQKIGEIEPHIHDFFEVVLILSGTCTVTAAQQISHLQADDVIAFDCHTPHSLRGSECVLISVQFDQTLFENTLPHPFRPSFFCDSSRQGQLPAFDAIRRQIARLVKNNAEMQSGYELRNWSIIYDLMDVLYNHFRLDDTSVQSQKLHRYADRMSAINRIINEHYMENFTLTRLADEIHLSAPYLSKFFEQHYGMTFLNYLTEIRINHAVTELTQTDHNIELVSANSGFPNSHSFAQAFKKRYQMLPSAWRRQARISKAPENTMSEPEQHDYIAGLKKYLDSPAAPHLPEQVASVSIQCSVSAEGTPLTHSWRKLMPGGSARDLLFSNIQEMVRRMQREIGFEYIRFHGIFSDDMRLVSRGTDGKLSYSFLFVDEVLDFLFEMKLKPVIEFSFMPETMAKTPQKKFINYCTSEPRSLSEWCELVEAFIRHILARYGTGVVRTWLFTPWSLPDTPIHMFGFSSKEAFYEFYRATWITVKKLDPQLCFGAPSTYYIVGEEHWYATFLNWCEGNDCPPDFLNFHYYDTVQQRNSYAAMDLFGFANSMTLGESPDGLSDFVRQVRRDLAARSRSGKARGKSYPVYLTEWNNTPSHQDWLNDTCFKSCYLVKGILENMDALESFCYWSLSDWTGESAIPSELFFGGLGLFTKNGIPKASYYALTLLRHLGNVCIGQGSGWYATKERIQQEPYDVYQILLYNYRHFSHLYALGERFDMTFTDRYTPFSPEQSMDAAITLTDLPEGTYMVREVSVGRKSGSAFDEWVSMGAEELEEEELTNLEGHSRPGITKYTAATDNGVLKLNVMLEMLEVKLVMLRRIKDAV
ncbi:MAG: helix-turn-helix domain-containing protein [Clostridiales bacterium]|nr:helix-turn-helix domain-containing protein [Clostridiales bacterium]